MSRLEENLITADKVRELQRKLYLRAKSQPNFRFYALYDKIYRMDVLEKAWQKVRANHGCAGVDGKTIEEIEKGVEDCIKGIQEELKTGRYRPSPTKRVYIPKKNGGQRPLSIPTVKDRVVQMSLKLIIEPIFEAGFEDNSYGYRPKRSAQQAVTEIRKYLNKGINKVIEADLEDCFGSIPHKEMLDMIARKIVDKRVMRLIKLLLKAGVMDREKEDKEGKVTPQGGGISPLLANIYLDQMDKGWEGEKAYARIIRYADDIVIITKYNTERAYRKLQSLTEKLKLKLNEKKTKIVDIEKEGFNFLGYNFRKRLNRKGKRKIVYFCPTEEAEKGIRGKVKKITKTARPIKINQVIKELNPVIRGWVNYYRIGNASSKFGKIKWYVESRIRKFMRKRRNESGYGHREYSDKYLYEKLGLYRDYRIRWAKALR